MLKRFFFSTFPRGRSGAGLLLVRMTLGVAALVQGVLFCTSQAGILTGVSAISASILLLAGFLTPMAAIASACFLTIERLSFAASGTSHLLSTNRDALLTIAIAMSLLLSGPGAYSVDARLFGPREILIVPASRPQDQ